MTVPKRSLREVLEELSPGVYGRNFPAWAQPEPNVCKRSGLDPLKCRCGWCMPVSDPKMTTEEITHE